MKLPTLNTLETSREMTAEFRGYNHNHSIGGGEFYDMKNLTSSYYPLLSPRGKRGTYRFENEVVDDEGNIIERPTNVQGIIAKDNLCFVADGKFYINGYKVDGFDLDPEGQKHLVSMGAYVVIFPDKKYINTLETSDCGRLENEQDSEGPVGFSITDKDGSDMVYQPTKPPEPQNGDRWLDTSVKPNALKQWNESTGMWVQIATTYVRIESTGIGKGFKDGDGVIISGLKDVQLVESISGGNISDDGISAIDGAFVIQKCTDDYIIVIGIIDEAISLSNKITIERKVPDMDFVVESENRLWGCKYGPVYTTDENDNEVFEKNVNELYACKLGDFKNWNCFERISTDSYVASLGSDGIFTGAITHLGYPLFFKEDCVHKVYGNYPANFQIQTIACRGVQAGCSESLAIVNEVLYYKSKSGVCAYDGSLPAEISAEFGEERYGRTTVDERQKGVKVAYGGSHGNKYYISMRHDMTGEYHLFVYDTAKGMWHKEDNTKAEGFCFCNGELYYIEGGEIRTMFGSGVPDTEPVEWMAETGVIGVYSPDKKYLSRLNVSLSLDVGTRVQFYVQYDSIGDYEHVCSLAGTSLRSFAVPIKPKRCNHMRLRIVGVGDAKIYNITKTIEQGSDI